MTYFKILSNNGETVGVEAIADPAYVRWQAKNELLIRCSKREAEGLISDKDNDTLYVLEGKTINGVGSEEFPSAVVISEAEYDEYMAQRTETEDPEDDNPEIPTETPEGEVLTRAQLTEKVLALEDELAAAKILLGVSDE